MTGKQILQPVEVTEFVRPVMWGPTGNYALSVEWNDGHSIIYPYRQICALIEEEEKKEKDEKNKREIITFLVITISMTPLRYLEL